MTVTTITTTREQLIERRDAILRDLELTWDELVERHDSGYLTPEQWTAWDELDGIVFLLNE